VLSEELCFRSQVLVVLLCCFRPEEDLVCCCFCCFCCFRSDEEEEDLILCCLEEEAVLIASLVLLLRKVVVVFISCDEDDKDMDELSKTLFFLIGVSSADCDDEVTIITCLVVVGEWGDKSLGVLLLLPRLALDLEEDRRDEELLLGGADEELMEILDELKSLLMEILDELKSFFLE